MGHVPGVVLRRLALRRLDEAGRRGGVVQSRGVRQNRDVRRVRQCQRNRREWCAWDAWDADRQGTGQALQRDH